MRNKKHKKPKRNAKRHPQVPASPVVTPVVIQAAASQNTLAAEGANRGDVDEPKWTEWVMAPATKDEEKGRELAGPLGAAAIVMAEMPIWSPAAIIW